MWNKTREEDKGEQYVVFTENALIIEGVEWTKVDVPPAKTYLTTTVGKYKTEYGDYIEIKEDGTFVVFVESQYFTGTWKQEGSKIWFTGDGKEDGEEVCLILLENTLIDPEEPDKWIKER